MWNKTLKLDLHTHPFETMGFPEPTIETVERIVKAIRRSGIDGIAITEHENREYGFKASKIASKHFKDVIIVPGWEVTVSEDGPEQARQIVEIFLDDGNVFRFQAHPQDERGYILRFCHEIEVYNSLHREVDTRFAERLAKRYGLLPLRNSDAHILERIGSCFNEISLEDLVKLAKKHVTSQTIKNVF